MPPALRVGVDHVDVARLARVLSRRPGLAARVFTEAEREVARRRATDQRLAARFAAKEAGMKALGVGLGAVRLRDLEVVTEPGGRPRLELHGAAGARARALGLTDVEVSLTHTEALATAVVVAHAGG